ncbi:hypothetical protein Tco_0345638 [Tanacetum coccineum]
MSTPAHSHLSQCRSPYHLHLLEDLLLPQILLIPGIRLHLLRQVWEQQEHHHVNLAQQRLVVDKVLHLLCFGIQSFNHLDLDLQTLDDDDFDLELDL